MYKTVKGTVNKSTDGHLIFKTVRRVVNIIY